MPYPHLFSPFKPEAFTFLDNSNQPLPFLVPKTLGIFSDGVVNLDIVPDVDRKQDISCDLKKIDNPFVFFENLGIILESMKRKEIQNQMQQNHLFFDLGMKLGMSWASRRRQKRITTHHYIDAINEHTIPADDIMCVDSSSDILGVNGWAVNVNDRKTAGGVIVKVDEEMFLSLYGFPRDDVALALGQPQYRNSGFMATLPNSLLDDRIHTLSIYILSHDRKSYYVSDRKVKFTIKKKEK